VVSAASFAADDFTLASPSFEDNGKLAVKNAGNDKSNPNCVGENVSPPLEWRNPPTGTKSFVLILVDPEGRAGLGVVHWVASRLCLAGQPHLDFRLTAAAERKDIFVCRCGGQMPVAALCNLATCT
jgi:hypothetical protein